VTCFRIGGLPQHLRFATCLAPEIPNHSRESLAAADGGKEAGGHGAFERSDIAFHQAPAEHLSFRVRLEFARLRHRSGNAE
jgi:hypothetical protein